YDISAYIVISTYDVGMGTLDLYITYPAQPTGHKAFPEYYMVKLGSFALIRGSNTFREALTAFRNMRDWAKEHRNRFIAEANAKVRGLRR
ncbi:hypothetical protein K469DRAFT_592727, partial [Zopfia rhizophila CBS 207.26]